MFPTSDASNTKFVLDRINQVEKYLGGMCVQFGKVCRKEARVRDCNDQFVQNMFEFADRERLNTSLRQSLQQYASYLSAVEDYRDTLIKRIETQILEPLAKYGEIMKYKRQAVQKAINARDKEVQRQRKLRQTSNRNPGSRDTIAAMQVNAEYAQTESSRADQVVRDEMDRFEEMKLTDIKKHLTDFTLIHLAFHARAMEMYTYAHQQLLNIDIAHDLEEFRTTGPFHRLHSGQRSVSEPVLNHPRRTTRTDSVRSEYSDSMSTITDHRYDQESDSQYSLSEENNPYRGGSLGRGDNRKSQPIRAGLHNSNPIQEHSSKHGTTGASNKSKPAKPDVTESYSSNSSDSDD